jgi:NAD(P)-dependent dehydrogenase (short-subunit alcohol dehydrogenase family)
MGIPGCDAYTATKGATLTMTRSMAVEFGPKGVRVNCICPASIDTEMAKESNFNNPAFDAKFFFSRAPLRRFGTAEEVANVAVFLASDEASYVNGAILRCDGASTIAPIT